MYIGVISQLGSLPIIHPDPDPERKGGSFDPPKSSVDQLSNYKNARKGRPSSHFVH